ncbi:MAG: shikimate dehydrogenase [Chloroflexota bacterium]
MTAYTFGLIGYPLHHSLSPRIHQQFLREFNLSGNYHLYPIPEDENKGQAFVELLAKMRKGELHGLNVTIPHKQNIVSYLDALDGDAEILQAVNTVYWDGKKLIGANTDVQGFWMDLSRFLHLAEGGRALVIGAGGAARAVVYALLKGGWEVVLAARKVDQARDLMKNYLQRFPGGQDSIPVFPISLETINTHQVERLGDVRLIINATPLGMAGHAQISPLPNDFSISTGTMVYDLVYNPPETALLKWARSKGAKIANGLGMLMEQAALAFERWTGKKPTLIPELLPILSEKDEP